jgi:hypothetical protein
MFRHTPIAFVFTLMAVVSAGVVRAADPTSGPTTLPSQLDESVGRALDYLVNQQNPDGSFSPGRNPDGTPATVASPPLATTGLTLMAFLSCGHTPDVGRYGLVVRNALEYLIANVPDDGYIGAIKSGKGDDSKMIGHGAVTLALAQAYGVENDRARRVPLRMAITKMLGVILAAQAVEKSQVQAGGWGIAPDSRDSDLLLSGWHLLALRACKDAGFNVPADAMQRAMQYVLKCRNPLDKGFAYQPGAPGQLGPTAIGILCLNLLDTSHRPELAEAEKFLAQSATQTAQRFALTSTYFTMQASLYADEPAWTAYAKPAFESLIKSQSPDGGLPASAAADEPGRATATALGVLTLAVPYRLLPIDQ